MALVDLVVQRIDLYHRITRHRGCLYAGDVTVTDARHLTAEVRPVALTDARRRSAKDSTSYKPGLDHEQPLVQSDNALAIHAFDAKPDMFVPVNGKLEEPPDSSVVHPRSFYTSFLLRHLDTSSSYCLCATRRLYLYESAT